MCSVGSAPAVLTPTHIRARSKATPYLPSYLEAGQLCVVCGDAATGLHYRAITCEGCKGFFRRTAQRRLSYTCKNNEQCAVNRNTRNGCQRCRLLKCYAEGMTTELVLDDAARVQKRELIRENRVRRELERTLDSLRIRPHPTPSSQHTHSLTHAYCVHVDRVPEAADLNHLISSSARRNKYFAHSLDVFGKLDHSEQAELLECSLLDVQLLRFLSFYDETADCFEVNGRSVSSASLLASLPVGSPLVGSLLVADMFWLAKQLSRLQLCNRQLAVIYAILIFNPDNLPQASSILETADQLHLQLGALCEENDERTAGKMLAHLISHVKQVRILSAALVPHFTPANAAFFTTMMSV